MSEENKREDGRQDREDQQRASSPHRAPLADRMRPRSLDEFLDSGLLLGNNSFLRTSVQADRIPSLILWGPPGCGKTTLARLLAGGGQRVFENHSAVQAGVKEIRSIVSRAKQCLEWEQRGTILFLDEIHRFNKSQQDALLPHVEDGTLTLIGATTENPSFEVNAALLSRCQVVPLPALGDKELKDLIAHSLEDCERGLGSLRLGIEEEAQELLIEWADGDGRSLLNTLEAIALHVRSNHASSKPTTPKMIASDDLESFARKRHFRYDKSGEEHYNLISALHKSLRGSDPQASVYWTMRMIESGEDPLYVVRRMVRFASEDIGNADPHALVLAMSTRDAVHFLGMPEADTALAQLAIYLATAPKSHASYLAVGEAKKAVHRNGSLPVPLSLRNSPTPLMKELGYGKDHQYPHDHSNAYVAAEYLPDSLVGQEFYRPSNFGFEREIAKRMEYWSRLKKASTLSNTGGEKKK